MDKVKIIHLQHRIKENGDKVLMTAYSDGSIEITIADKLVTIASNKREINTVGILSLSGEEAIMLDDFMTDLISLDIDKLQENLDKFLDKND